MPTSAQVKTKPTLKNAFEYARYQLSRHLKPHNPVRTIASELKLMLSRMNRHGVCVDVEYNDYSKLTPGFDAMMVARVIFDDYTKNPFTDGSMYEIGIDGYGTAFVAHYFQDPEDNYGKTMGVRHFEDFNKARDYLVAALNYHFETPLTASKSCTTRGPALA